MSVLIIKNASNEGPGTIEDYLKAKRITYTIADFSGCDATEEVIPDITEVTHLVILGGPMAVYDSDGLPFLHFEVAMIRGFIVKRRPVLGICLGAQMIAYALGANVYRGGSQEVGWYRVDITDEGMEDAALSSLAIDNKPVAEVFQWHGDTFDLPDKAVRLSSSGEYNNQAFRYRESVYALQFHIEVKPEMIEEWLGKEDNGPVMVKESRELFPDYQKRAFNFYEIFFQ